ncbi:hypothetical protein PIB19_21970 [Sphingomonas sp. 7/4-4]|uniref:hypothetical protein n=1 Tax=Sphingomonas sp. 7/4-4 TaxID=3018446 RepID=UPI0022F3C422|nr:hypothetical protein [Sphingomonas sp. 7/4-4]WBY07888.1 hypothetical protein PIB19_21970 [Sphingomonas sp. 7/4-4]
MDIYDISLRSEGWFVARMQILYQHGDDEEKVIEIGGDLLMGQYREAGLRKLSIPEGSKLKLRARVIAGKDNTVDHGFTFRSKSNTMAQYQLNGTTFHNSFDLHRPRL